MHAQVQKICNTVRKATDGRYWVTLTSGQYTPMGKVLGFMYYRTKLTDFENEKLQLIGYPHNGGEHSLTVGGDRGEVVAFVELLKEIAQPRFANDAEISRVISELSFVSQDLLALK